MGIISKEVAQTWNPRNKDKYISLGYRFTKIGDKFLMNVEHLSDNSNVKVTVKCDKCGRVNEIPYRKYLANIARNKHYNCKTHLKQYYYDYFKNEGYQLISDYKNAKQKLKTICPKGHEYITTFNGFQYGYRCNKCSVEFRSDLNRFDAQYVRETFEKRGFILLSKEYINSHQKLEYICPKGHISTTRFATFKNGHGCFICANQLKGSNRRLNFSFVKQIFEDKNYKLLSTRYVNSISKLDAICPKGHKIKISFTHLYRGHGCKECGYAEIARKLKENDAIPISRQQKYIHKIIGGELNYIVNNFYLDIAFPEDKIFVEYDGGGHDLSVKLGTISIEKFIKQGERRSNILKKKGWKEVRILSSKDYLMVEKDINEFWTKCLDYLRYKNGSYVCLNIDDKTLQFDNDINEIIINNLFKLKWTKSS